MHQQPPQTPLFASTSAAKSAQVSGVSRRVVYGVTADVTVLLSSCSRPGWAASAPEFGEPLGKGSALVVTGSGGGRARRRIHQVGAECVAGVAVGEDGFDSAAAC